MTTASSFVTTIDSPVLSERPSVAGNSVHEAPTTNLLPRERGAYATLLIPIVTTWFIAGVNPAALLLSMFAIGVFFTSEPIRVLLGHRGTRFCDRHRQQAWVRLQWLVPAWSAAAAASWLLGDTNVQIGMSLVAVMSVGYLPWIWTREERSSMGPLAAVIVITSWIVPITLAGGLSFQVALGMWATWSAAFLLGTSAVRSIIAKSKGKYDWCSAATPPLVTMVGFVLVTLGRIELLAVLPVFVVSETIVAIGPSPRQLKKIGWTLVATTLVTAGWMIMIVG